jgi:hypothetical protein
MSKQSEINEAAKPTMTHEGAPRTRSGLGSVGGETKAEMGEAFGSNPGMEKNPLRGAVTELHAQHPIAHDDHGPHHGTDHHLRHEPLHGLKRR